MTERKRGRKEGRKGGREGGREKERESEADVGSHPPAWAKGERES